MLGLSGASRVHCLLDSSDLRRRSPRTRSAMPLRLYAAGSNARGQLALVDAEDAHVFTPCVTIEQGAAKPSAFSSIADVVCGANHTLVIADGAVWYSGTNSRGQCGLGDAVEEAHGFRRLAMPPELAHLPPAFVACLWESSFVVLRGPDEDILVSFGSNDFGDLGRGENADSSIRRVNLHSALPQHTCSDVRVAKIATGPHHVVVLLDCTTPEGAMRAAVGWGAARHGQLGLHTAKFVSEPTLIDFAPSLADTHVTSAACGNQHTLLLRANGTAAAFGSNRRGQAPAEELGALRGVVQLACCWSTSFCLTRDATLDVFGNGAHGQLGVSPEAAEQRNTLRFGGTSNLVSRVVCGSEHVLAVTQNGEVLGWGWNEHGNLGLGQTQDVVQPVRIWPPTQQQNLASRRTYSVHGVWAGCGTTWIAVDED